MELIQVKVLGVANDPINGTPIVLLAEKVGTRALPVWIGAPEANAISLALDNIKVERPLTHDLIASLLDGLSAKVEKVAITELSGNTFYARIFLRRQDELFTVDARPSDSIAIALRARAPVLVARDLLYGPAGVEIEDDGEEDLADKLRQMKPEDFGKYKL
ncbi:MAG: bifunctional nuclease family protein [Candidatus Edwardsbacteria bacterium]|nr:bifunctional nuclease family protein [Candidatus Edwardsbacteria bacterium]